MCADNRHVVVSILGTQLQYRIANNIIANNDRFSTLFSRDVSFLLLLLQLIWCVRVSPKPIQTRAKWDLPKNEQTMRYYFHSKWKKTAFGLIWIFHEWVDEVTEWMRIDGMSTTTLTIMMSFYSSHFLFIIIFFLMFAAKFSLYYLLKLYFKQIRCWMEDCETFVSICLSSGITSNWRLYVYFIHGELKVVDAVIAWAI